MKKVFFLQLKVKGAMINLNSATYDDKEEAVFFAEVQSEKLGYAPVYVSSKFVAA